MRERIVYLLANRFVPDAVVHPTEHHREKLDASVKETVIDFFDREDVTWTNPGKEDFISVVQENGEQVQLQKKYLLMSMTETYTMFIQEYGRLLGRSLFCNLRPEYVLPFAKTPHNVCMCQLHEDFIA
jgi:hypothetical protein